MIKMYDVKHENRQSVVVIIVVQSFRNRVNEHFNNKFYYILYFFFTLNIDFDILRFSLLVLNTYFDFDIYLRAHRRHNGNRYLKSILKPIRALIINQ